MIIAVCIICIIGVLLAVVLCQRAKRTGDTVRYEAVHHSTIVLCIVALIALTIVSMFLEIL